MMEMCTPEGKYFSCINGDTLDTSKKLDDNFGNTCWLDDAYTHQGWTWDSHLCHGRHKTVSFRAIVHQAHKEFYVGWRSLTDFQFCIEIFQLSIWWYDYYIMILNLYDDGMLFLFFMIGRTHMIP